jgi:hypothetical protein
VDLNYFLHRHQVSLMLGERAQTCEARSAHVGLASGYAARIRDVQQSLGATFAAVSA